MFFTIGNLTAHNAPLSYPLERSVIFATASPTVAVFVSHSPFKVCVIHVADRKKKKNKKNVSRHHVDFSLPEGSRPNLKRLSIWATVVGPPLTFGLLYFWEGFLGLEGNNVVLLFPSTNWWKCFYVLDIFVGPI